LRTPAESHWYFADADRIPPKPEEALVRRVIALGLALVLASAGVSNADEHLVSAAQRDARLVEAPRQRAADLERIHALLARPDAARAVARFGVGTDAIRRAVPLLDDAELHELAVRASALQADPVAGRNQSWIFLIVLAVVVVLVVIVLGVRAAMGSA
jgi:hypothetical protein